jgi:hypothetical protein
VEITPRDYFKVGVEEQEKKHLLCQFISLPPLPPSPIGQPSFEHPSQSFTETTQTSCLVLKVKSLKG